MHSFRKTFSGLMIISRFLPSDLMHARLGILTLIWMTAWQAFEHFVAQAECCDLGRRENSVIFTGEPLTSYTVSSVLTSCGTSCRGD